MIVRMPYISDTWTCNSAWPVKYFCGSELKKNMLCWCVLTNDKSRAYVSVASLRCIFSLSQVECD